MCSRCHVRFLMPINAPIIMTLFRIALIPVLVLALYLPLSWANELAVVIFIVASATDWLDGWWARRTGQTSSFGAFLDPVADKLMVSAALIVVVQQHPDIFLALAAAVIICREITVSALREWMAEIGRRGLVSVGMLGKVKTTVQLTAIGFLLYGEPIWVFPIFHIGLLLLIIAAVLTLWSMFIYLAAAWPTLKDEAN